MIKSTVINIKKFRDTKKAALTVALGFIVVSFVIAYVVHVSQKAFLERAINVSAERYKTDVIKRTSSIIATLNRMGLRWHAMSGMDQSIWRIDSKQYINDTKGAEALMWIDANGILRWAEKMQHVQGLEEGAVYSNDEILNEKMELSKATKLPEFTQVKKISDNNYSLHILYPIWKNNKFDGFIGIRLNVNQLILGTMGEVNSRGFLLHAYADNRRVYFDSDDVNLKGPFGTFKLNLDSDQDGWEFKVYPTKEVLSLFQSPIPLITFISGFLIAVLFYITLNSRIKAKEAANLLENEVEKRQVTEQKLEHMSKYDALTHMPNRSYLNIYLENKVKECAAQNEKFAVLVLNLDGFKQINEIYGHKVADQILKAIPTRINSVLLKNAMIAHMSSDEFVICISENLIDQKMFIYAEDLLKEVRKPILIDSHNIRVTASIGVCYYPEHAHTADELITRAEQAMGQAKNIGKDVYTIFDERLESSSIVKAEMIQSFNLGIDEGEFEMFFQPRHDIKSGLMVGAEALIRWNKNGEYLTPDAFLSVAEESGMIVSICNSAFDKAFAQYNELFNGNPSVMLSINVSAKQLSHVTFLNDLFAMMEKHQFPSEMLEVELTEQALIENFESSLSTLNALDSSGIGIALDDFGTGYSSLSYLKNFPVSVLKIDKSFIRDIHKDIGDLELTKAIIAMGKSLSMEVVAEGVENKKQLNILDQEGCHQAQGYLMNKPLKYADFKKLFDNKLN